MNNEQPPNEHTDPWESEMSREFDKRVRDLHEAPLTFDNVKGKAMTIRRNRRVAVAGGILAAAAVVVPIAVLAGNSLGDTNEIPPTSTSPSPTQATDPNPTEAPEPSSPSYLEGTTWHRADGSTVELDEAYFSGVELGDQLVAVSNDDNTGAKTIDVIDSDGSVVDSFPTWSEPVANADHTLVAYIATNGTVTTRTADGESEIATGLVDGNTVAAITGGPDCDANADGCLVIINRNDGTPPQYIDSSTGEGGQLDGVIDVNDVSTTGLVVGQTGSTDTGSCNTVFDGPNGPEVFKTCDAYLFDFSPGGAYLSGTHPYLDGIGNGYATILDATNGEELARFTPEEGYVRNQVWEDPEHLLVNAYDEGEWRVYRLGVDGSSEQVLSSTEGDDMTPAFSLLS